MSANDTPTPTSGPSQPAPPAGASASVSPAPLPGATAPGAPATGATTTPALSVSTTPAPGLASNPPLAPSVTPTPLTPIGAAGMGAGNSASPATPAANGANASIVKTEPEEQREADGDVEMKDVSKEKEDGEKGKEKEKGGEKDKENEKDKEKGKDGKDKKDKGKDGKDKDGKDKDKGGKDKDKEEEPDMSELFAARRADEAARRDRSLAEFLVMLDGYKPLIPEEVTEYYLQRAGFECSDPRLKRLLSLSAQKFVSDLSRDAFHFAKLRVGGTAAGRGRPNAASERNRVVLTMDDLSLALGEHGVNVKKPDYYL